MIKRIRRTLLCLLIAASMAASGSAYTDDDKSIKQSDTVSKVESSSDTEKFKRSEAVEKVELSVEDAEKYLKKIGYCDGYDVYFKSKDFDDALWKNVGGKPKSKKDYTPEQQETADKIDELKKLGELVIIDSKSGKAAASFKSGIKCDEGTLYVSEAGRFFVLTDEDTSRVIRLRKIVSTLDSKYAFLSADKKTLEFLRSDMKGTDKSLNYDRTEDGKRIYKSADGEFAWLTANGSHYLGAFRYGAENNKLRMIIDDRSASFGIENKENGYIWWSSPLGASQDKTATGLVADELRSSNTLRYGIPMSRSGNNILRSGSDADCVYNVSDIENGIRVIYGYKDAGFTIPVEYTIEDDHLRAKLKISEIAESKPENIATEMTLLGSFGAASDDEDGYFVIPDGCGALVRFNNGRTTQTNLYQQRIYGNDVTAVPQNRGALTEQIYLPVFGIVRGDNALLAVAAKGDSNAYITANVSGQSKSRYNTCNFTFILRGTDTFYMSGNSHDKYTVFEKGSINSDDIELLYYPIVKKGADYTDIADRYRQYLLEEQGVEKRSNAGKAPLYLDLYGGVMKKKSVLGIPISFRTSITDFGQAVDIISELKERGVKDMVISYSNWTSDGIKNKVDKNAKPSGKLGGIRDFRSLTDLIDECGYSLYPVSDNRDFNSGNGYYSFSDTAVRVSGSYSRIVSYDRAYGIPDGFRKNLSLLTPDCYGEVLNGIAENYSNAGLVGVSLASLTSSLYGDYGKKSISRAGAEKLLTDGYENITEKLEGRLLADKANAYALPYVNHITGVPMTSSRFDLFDEDVPFYQIVMHGVIPYSAEAVNGSPNPEWLMLMAAATGSFLSYDMIHEETSELKDTDLDFLYYANYKGNIKKAAEDYALIEPLLSRVSDCYITDYRTDGNIITTEYSDGTRVVTNFEKMTVRWNGGSISLRERS